MYQGISQTRKKNGSYRIQAFAEIIVILILSSCVTQKKCFDKFPSDTVTVIKDTTLYRDTVIYRTVKGDTVYKEVKLPYSVPIDRTYQPITVETSLAVAKAWVSLDRLKLSLVQKDSVFRFKLDSAIQANKETKIVTKIVEKPIPPKPLYKIGFFILGVLFIFTIVLVVFRK